MAAQAVEKEELFSGLNEEQRQAVVLPFCPALIVAGAGSGKTTVLTRRVAYLLSALAQSPSSILAVTFTNKAAGEMKSRLAGLVGEEVSRRLWIGTFHSVCARLLRREIESYSTDEGWQWKSNFVIYDETDSLNVLKAVISRLNLDDKVFAPRDMRHAISSLKNDGYTQARFAAEARNYRETRLSEIFSAYQVELARNNALDFDDLILVFADLLRSRPEVLERQRQQFRHVLVDEFQDTNQSQYELVRLLCPQSGFDGGAGERSLMVVGDVDQSIYSWRKADFRIILGFQNDYKNARLIKLEENYRSTQTILDVANDVISNNSERIEKVLRCNRGRGGKVQCFQAMDENDEAYFVVDELKKLSARGKALADTVVLYRTNAQSRALEEALVRSHMPYTMVGATRFYDRQEIKDALAYLKLVYNTFDGQSFLRIINTPRRGIGKTSIERLEEYAVRNQLSLLDAALSADRIPDISSRTAKCLKEFAIQVQRWQSLSACRPVSALIDAVLTESKYLDRLEEEHTSQSDPLAGGRIENLRELVVVASEFESIADEPTLEAFLTRVSLVSDLDSVSLGEDAVKLMTLHSAKGLEFSTVFLVGLEEGLFPHMRSLNSPAALEEERRLMYVGVTRAADALYLTYARRRMLFGSGSFGQANYTTPSRFLKEINLERLQGFYPGPETAAGIPPGEGGPGFRRYQANTVEQRPARLERADQRPKPRAFRLEKPDSPAGEEEPVKFDRLVVGDMIQHAKFGIGQVTQVIGEKDKELYNIEFEAAGKRLMDPRFAKLVKLN